MKQTSVKGSLEAILLSVIDKNDSVYGLEIVREVAERTNGAVQLNAGSLYPALHRLEKRGCLTVEMRTPPQGGGPVGYYSVTDEGRRVLAEQRKELRTIHRHIEGLVYS